MHITMLNKISMIVRSLALLLFMATSASAQQSSLSAELLRKDSLLFAVAMGSCDFPQLDKVFTRDYVMYHDNGYGNPGSAQPYADLAAFIKKSCVNKAVRMRRELVRESVQVFPLGDREAMQMGVHRFFVQLQGQPERQVEESKFARTWRKEGSDWKIAREINYLVKNQFPTEARYQPEPYVPASPELHNTIAQLDSLYFGTYNNCDTVTMAAMMSDSLEFYHDRTGFSASKADNLASVRKNICGKVTRTLVKGSLEVYAIPSYGALEIGYHQFKNTREAGISHPSKFMILWQHRDNQWKIARVISLH